MRKVLLLSPFEDNRGGWDIGIRGLAQGHSVTRTISLNHHAHCHPKMPSQTQSLISPSSQSKGLNMPFTQAFTFLHPDLSLLISPLLNHTDCVISHEVLFRPVTDNSGRCSNSPQFRHIRKCKWCTTYRAHLVSKEEAECFNSKLHVLSSQ